MARVYGVGIIGAGTIFRDHAEAYRRLRDRARIIALAEVDESKRSRAAKQHGIEFVCGDYHELLHRDDIDIVNICTPPCLHEEMAIAALEAGKYVICEKPLAHNVQSADRIVEVAAKCHGRLSVCYQLRFMADVRKTIWLRDQGRLGRLLFGHFTRFDRLPANTYAWWGKWDTAGGGVAMTQFIHQLDVMCHVFGRPVEVEAEIDTLKAPIESEDTIVATVRFDGGAMVNCAASLCAKSHSQTWDVCGMDATVHNPWQYETNDAEQRRRDEEALARLYPSQTKPPKPPSKRLPARALRKTLLKLGLRSLAESRPPSEHLAYFRSLLDAIDAGRALPVSAEEALVSLELCTAIYVSGITRQRVRLPLDRSLSHCAGITSELYQQSMQTIWIATNRRTFVNNPG